MTGLRERKKQRTRDALIRASHELFVTRGYDETTIDEITDVVDVSQRTFFRYFSSKEAVAFALQDEVETRFCVAALNRPSQESPAQALRNALTSTWTGAAESVHKVVPMNIHMRMWRLIETTPALLAAHMWRSAEMEDRLTSVIATREGIDTTTDLRPRVLVAQFSGVMRSAGRQWAMTEDITLRAMKITIEKYLDLMGPALDENWSNGESHGDGPSDTQSHSDTRQ
ncbi:TetR family transcriptional regulator [Streptomyces oceani]|uniref:HTH tetR-type domain-containing protein n=1 Tax=Streptomyces oceani TaxID=1075402 RepID=A0A1E7KFE0_9ACTN|nr:hypothetical protein AN216_13860 [Streptomyces oceani]